MLFLSLTMLNKGGLTMKFIKTISLIALGSALSTTLAFASGDLAAALGWLLSRNRILESTAAAPPFGMKNGIVTSRYLGGARIEVRTAH